MHERDVDRRLAAGARIVGLLGGALALALVLGCGGAPVSPPQLAPEVSLPAARVTPHGEWAEAILYFVMVDRFADGNLDNDGQVDVSAPGAFHGGDLRGLREHLDELAELGVTAIWITPVVQNVRGFVTGAGFPDWAYHGYWADDFERVDPRFGSEEELAALVAAAHERGMAVLLDVVYNHVGYDSRFEKSPARRRWLRMPADGTCGNDDVTSCVAGLPDLKTELDEVADYLFEAHLGLAERTGVDGFRLDTVKHVDHPFWQEHRRRVRARLGEDFFLLGEVWGGDAQVLDPYFAADELDAGFEFSFKGNVVGFVSGRGRPIAFNAYLERRRDPREGHLLAPYLSSHDVPTALYELDGDVGRFRLALLLLMTSRGIPTLYYGEEVGRLGGEWPQNRSDMPWGDHDVLPGAGRPRDEALRADVRRMIAIRRAHPALWRGTHRGLEFGADHLVFLREDPLSEDRVVVVVNRGSEPAQAAFEIPAEWSGRRVRDLWSEEVLGAPEGRMELEIPPLGARILAIEE